MIPRRVLLALLAGLAGGALRAAPPATGDATLKETLLYGLRPRTPREQAFVDVVVAKVDADELPIETVVALYRWSRDKKPYPFPYFERALREKAKSLGVTF